MQSMASFVSQNVGAGNKKRARQTLFTGIAIGLVFGCAVFALVWFEGDLLSGIFTTDAAVIVNAFAYLRGFAPEAIVTAVLFSWWATSTATTRPSGSWCRALCRPSCPPAHGLHHEHPA